MKQKDMWLEIADLMRQHGFMLVNVDEHEENAPPRRTAALVARRPGRPRRPMSVPSVAGKISSSKVRRTGSLTDEQVREIREVYRPRTERVTAAALAKQYGVSIPTIRLIVTGTDAAKSKLTPEDLHAIREAYQPKQNSAADLARRFGVTPNTIISVAQGKTHKDVQIDA
jgi:DNA-binding XRE family transcriptional regulator